MNNARVDAVKQAFHELGGSKTGGIPIEGLLKKYDPTVHPRVIAKQKTPEEAYKEFEEAIIKRAYNVYFTL
jgi:hypothetical protein